MFFRLLILFCGILTFQTGVCQDIDSLTHPRKDSLKSEWENRKSAMMNEVIISASLKPISKLASPIPVEVYPAAFFRKNITTNLFDAMQMVNGVQPQLACNVCYTGGFQINGLDAPYTAVLIDGMPIVSSLSAVYGLSAIPNRMIKRIEVVKGPASTLYGSEAVAGLINIITKDPGESIGGDVEFTSNSYGEWSVDASLNTPMKKKKSLWGIHYNSFQGLRDRNQDGFTDIPQQKQFSIFNKWQWSGKSGLPSSMAFRFLTEDRWGGQLNWKKEFRGSDSIYAEHIKTNRFEWLGTVGLKNGKYLCQLDYSYNFHGQDAFYGTHPFKAIQHTAFTQVKWSGTNGSHDWVAGIPLRYIHYDDHTPGTPKASRSLSGGIYAQDEWSFHSGLSLLIGLREEWHNNHGLVTSPRVAVKWRAGEGHVFRVSGGNGFRVVNLFTEDHAALSGSREVVILEELEPEKSWNVNLNYAGHFHVGEGFLSLDASAFYTYFSNQIIADYDTDPDKIIYKNLDGYSVSKGLSLNTDINMQDRLRVGIGITWMDVFSVEGKSRRDRLYVPEWSGVYNAGYQIPSWKLAIDITGRVQGPMRMPVQPLDYRASYSPWYQVTNFQLTKTTGKRLQFYGGVKNVFDAFPKDPIMRPFDPFDKNVTDAVSNPNGYVFDPSYNYAPLSGRRVYLGVKVMI